MHYYGFPNNMSLRCNCPWLAQIDWPLPYFPNIKENVDILMTLIKVVNAELIKEYLNLYCFNCGRLLKQEMEHMCSWMYSQIYPLQSLLYLEYSTFPFLSGAEAVLSDKPRRSSDFTLCCFLHMVIESYRLQRLNSSIYKLSEQSTLWNIMEIM